MKKLILIALIIGVFVYILHSYGVFKNRLNLSHLDKMLVTNLNKADKNIDQAVMEKSARTILNKNRP